MLQQIIPGETAEDEEQLKSNQLSGLQFQVKNGLLYLISKVEMINHLCIPLTIEKEIFEIYYNTCFHPGFQRMYDMIIKVFYIYHLSRHLWVYISHCPECQLNQTLYHKPFRELGPITSTKIPFKTILIDWVTILLVIIGLALDQILTATCKFSKKMLFIPGVWTWKAHKWVDTFLALLMDHD